MTFVGL